MFDDADKYELANSLKEDLRLFLESVCVEGIGIAGLFKEMGLQSGITLEIFEEHFQKTFGL
ncbi:hypothetical protein [Methanolapillus millepedarum]|uniref:Uncharacterized protein n=1 Tax=Methanolapillus millepedarum TaxID=3028296 RepID=A0AA96V1X9_9EURY|nr:hypothetical protein MsAc7_04710 [Methanosarcinaceae archaeon Ac7]